MPGAQEQSRRRALLAGALGIFCCGLAVGAARSASPVDAPVAVVTDLRASASLLRAGHRRALEALDVLDRSDELVLAENARVEIAYFSGVPRLFLLFGPGRFLLHDDAVIGRHANDRIAVRDLAQAWRALHIEPALLGRASVALRAASGADLRIQSPVGAQLEADLDALRWKTPYGRGSQSWQYAVRLIDAQGAVLFSANTRDTMVALPAQLPWAREQPYLWTIEALADDGRRAETATEFRLVDRTTQERMDALAKITEQARAQQTDTTGTAEDVLFAIALDQAGLLGEANRRWQAVAQMRPAFARQVAKRP
ncbi:MAG TPA: hypothetical protein VEI05_04210 [Burkholderiaceae bacterium]|nr:hypothetical protein [Burkholderiaceae bacterium]